MFFWLKENNDYVTIYKGEFSEKRAPEVTEYIEIDKELHAKLFFKDFPVPLSHWLSSNKKKHARELSNIPKNFCW